MVNPKTFRLTSGEKQVTVVFDDKIHLYTETGNYIAKEKTSLHDICYIIFVETSYYEDGLHLWCWSDSKEHTEACGLSSFANEHFIPNKKQRQILINLILSLPDGSC